ncbi:hypothetical protein EON64_06330 [archaeon]|nr:MAG: hypothetical protein EON64_06330 [archaeon]
MYIGKYAYLGGFNGTANVLAGKLFQIDVKGTHAHAYVMTYSSLADLYSTRIFSLLTREEVDFVSLVLQKRKLLNGEGAHEGELAAFISYAQAFPQGFLALIDTYDTLVSGLHNFLAVAWALKECGYRPLGVRLDSGDLAYLSKSIRKAFRALDIQIATSTGTSAASAICASDGTKKERDKEMGLFENLTIVASNDINEDILLSLNREGHEVGEHAIQFLVLSHKHYLIVYCMLYCMPLHHPIYPTYLYLFSISLSPTL